MWSLQSLNAIIKFSIRTAKEEVPSAISILQISTLEGGPGLLLLDSAILQSSSVCVVFPDSSMCSGTSGGRKQLLHKEKPRKMETKSKIKEKPQPVMLLWPLHVAIHEFAAVEQILVVFS